jgi:hypothetical protein
VTVARLAGSHIAGLDREALLRADVVVSIEDRDHVEHAMAEHLHAMLEPEELLVVALRAGRGLDRQLVAACLNLALDELDEVERGARVKCSRMVIAYHDEHICEPAALSAADTPAAVAAAVRAHLAGCRSCRKEFEERVWRVLAETGAIVKRTPPLHRPADRRRVLRRPGAVSVRRPKPPRAREDRSPAHLRAA